MFYVLIAVAATSRFLPHPPNVACIGALGLFAGCYLSGRRAYLVPLAAMLVSDIVGHFLAIPGMGFYNLATMGLVYAGVLATVPIGRWMHDHKSKLRLPAGSIAASTVFFLLSNFGVFLGGWYEMSLGGLASCYVRALPFYGYTIAGDLLFVGLLFGAYEMSRSFSGQMVPQRVRA